MNTSCRGYTLIEMMTVLAVMTILITATIPLGAFWVQSAKLSTVAGELTHSIGKAVGTALRNRYAINSDGAITTLCITGTDGITVREGTIDTAPSCSANTGTVIWTASRPDDVEITSVGDRVTCLCFDTSGLLTTNQCVGCLTRSSLDLSIGDKRETIFVY